jgi:pimeloyl-ACP methyl ester carboxylesterase
MKTVLFTPGFGDSVGTRDYNAVMDALESKGYSVKFVSIDWKRTIIDDWVRQLEVEYNKYDTNDVILAGFSYGSMTSFMAATRRNPSELWLFSFSPYFAEDIPYIKKWWANIIGKHRIVAFQKLHFDELAKSIKCPTTIMLGEIEVNQFELLTNRCRAAHKAIKGSRLIVVPKARHDVTNPNYIETIKSVV